MTAPTQIGTQGRAIALYLAGQFIAKDRLSEVMETVFHLPVSDASILKWEGQLAEDLSPFYKAVRDHLEAASLKHGDETGVRVNGKTQWMHVLCDPYFTYLTVDPKRKIPFSEESVQGVFMHDHFSSYSRYEQAEHVFCNAHHLRELRALMEHEKEAWAGKLYRLLQIMCHWRTRLKRCNYQRP